MIETDAEDAMPPLDDDSARDLATVLRRLLLQEKQDHEVLGERLTERVAQLEILLDDEHALTRLFERRLGELPDDRKPTTMRQKIAVYHDLLKELHGKLDCYKSKLQNAADGRQQVFESVRNKTLHILRHVAKGESIQPDVPTPPDGADPDPPSPGPTPDTIVPGGSIHVYLKIKSVEAEGIFYHDKKFVVLSGSRMAMNKPTDVRLEEKRRSLIDSGTVKNTGTAFQFTRDYEFMSPSTAASIIVGFSANGNLVWTDDESRPLGNIRES